MRTERADLRVNDSTLLRGHLNTGAVPSSFIEPYPPADRAPPGSTWFTRSNTRATGSWPAEILLASG
jgi:hypothetical protein